MAGQPRGGPPGSVGHGLDGFGSGAAWGPLRTERNVLPFWGD